jgi:hypothetical protein
MIEQSNEKRKNTINIFRKNFINEIIYYLTSNNENDININNFNKIKNKEKLFTILQTKFNKYYDNVNLNLSFRVDNSSNIHYVLTNKILNIIIKDYIDYIEKKI